jgi:hypothetical protein
VSEKRLAAFSTEPSVLVALALATVVLHAAVGDRYGFHADELATLDDARNLAWGYPGYPPVTAFFARISLILFGTNLVGFRFFASLAQAIAVALAGLMARDLGGSRCAQLFAAIAAVPFCIGGGALMQYVSFDYLAWVLVAFFVVRLCVSGDQRFWVVVGASIGFGMLSKYTMAFFVVGLVAGVLLTDLRRHLRSRWPWIGGAIAVLVFLPNLVWQWRHEFVALDSPLLAGGSPTGWSAGVEITCRIYKPRRARESPLFRLVEQHLEELLRAWPVRFARQHGPLRPVVERVLRGFMRCGLVEHGLSQALVSGVPDERALPVLVSRKVVLPVLREEAPAPVGGVAPEGGSRARSASPRRPHHAPPPARHLPQASRASPGSLAIWFNGIHTDTC